MSPDQLGERARAELDRLRSELERQFGWALLDVAIDEDLAGRRLVLGGEVVTLRALGAISERLTPLLPEGWRLDAAGLAARRTGRYHALVRPTPVWRELSRVAARSLTTELDPHDGPVEVIAQVAGATLVRGLDVTVGWIDDDLGEPVGAPRLEPAPSDVPRLVAELDDWLGTPYRLGGSRASGIDCSGLVQRCFRDALGIVLPRHSTDQLRFAAGASGTPSSGDLIFVWCDGERPGHVGIVRERHVVHASTSRQHVVEDAIDALTHGARRIERVRFEALCAAFARFVGRSSIELPGE